MMMQKATTQVSLKSCMDVSTDSRVGEEKGHRDHRTDGHGVIAPRLRVTHETGNNSTRHPADAGEGIIAPRFEVRSVEDGAFVCKVCPDDRQQVFFKESIVDRNAATHGRKT